MAVYVDNMKLRAKLFRWSASWSNLWADTTEELIDFADELGLTRASMIDEGYTTERFIITEKRRVQALELGAIGVAYCGIEILKMLRTKARSGKYKDKGL